MPGIKNFSLNKKSHTPFRIIFGVILLAIFLAILSFFNVGIKNIFFNFTGPIQKVFWSAGDSSSGFFGSLLNAGNLQKENDDLKNQIQKLESSVASLQAVVGANQAQSQVALSCQNNSFKLLLAGVVGLDNQDILSINKGSDDGVAENMPVINQQSALYGKVIKVYKTFSKVMLISSKSSVISVKVESASQAVPEPPKAPSDNPAENQTDVSVPAPAPEIDGVVKGSGKGATYLDLVPVDQKINKGDLLVVSSLETTFPKDLLVGTITDVEKNDQNPHQQAHVKSFMDSSAENLFVITNYKQ